MIEKIDLESNLRHLPNSETRFACAALKINELVDAVNILQAQVAILEEHAHPTAKTPDLPDGDDAIQEVIHADPYAEQRKWIGKLCKFWDYDGEEKWFSILEYIDKNSPSSYCASGDWWYKHCEPVKPDDDIIYKGGDNE